MPPPMSLELGLRIGRAVEDGSSIREAARRFAVSPSAAIELRQRVGAIGSAAPARYGGHRRPLREPYAADLQPLVAATPDITPSCARSWIAAGASASGSRRATPPAATSA
jgi:transposase